MGKKSRTKEGKRKKKKIGKKEINPKQKREEEERKGKREWDDGSTKRRWGSVGSTSSKSFGLDFEGGGEKERGEESERERKEEQEMMEREWMEFLWPNSGKQQSQSAPLFSCFGCVAGKLVWMAFGGAERAEEQHQSRVSQSESGNFPFLHTFFLSLFSQAPIAKGLDSTSRSYPAYTDIPWGRVKLHLNSFHISTSIEIQSITVLISNIDSKFLYLLGFIYSQLHPSSP